MAKGTCSIDGCGSPHASRGWCNLHYRRWQTYGDPQAPRPPRPKKPKLPCAIDGCSADRVARGWCRIHWARWKKHGDPLVTWTPREGCSIAGCEKPHAGRGLCSAHYSRLRRTGDPLGSIPRKPGSPGTPRPKKPCGIEGCGGTASARGWCSVHYTRFRMYGDPMFERPAPIVCSAEGCERNTFVGYCENHRHRILGANDHKCVANDYTALPDGTTRLTMRMVDGAVFTTVFDTCDLPLVQTRKWTVTRQGYIIGSGNVRLHRLLLGLSKGDGLTVDHVDGDRRNNRRSNLRATTNQRNVAHQAVVNHRGTSRFRNVHHERTTGRWNAEVMISRKKHWLGTFDTEDEAATRVATFRVEMGLPSGY